LQKYFKIVFYVIINIKPANFKAPLTRDFVMLRYSKMAWVAKFAGVRNLAEGLLHDLFAGINPLLLL